ncbi:fasciclin domain-containing protein [Antarcticibacterium flavum]|uniref:Fasciclin domain-containing protein n=1 Tax=Antarcticibacterium flavum TaxID=2058175 RepID=A0A5B7X4W8_9FLAO|nr:MULTISPECIES: fasciclin domain-containing protein [Antarcticibacterium]MCM4160011.1 hypothetical protein [Antarcticibacterium sp. W02-3]QCY70399.1 fasciclin domain-containing protein [Antarcticibacterium flavum]
MKLRNLMIIAVISAVSFTSCRDNAREVDDDQIELDRRAADRDAEMRANEARLERERNNVSTRISENQNLSTFSENMTRNQVSTSMRAGATGTAATGMTTQSQTGTQTQSQTGTTGDRTTTGTTTGDRATGTTGQTQSMQGQANYTIFAPSNDAYENLTDVQRQEMMDTQNRDRNVASINYLMVEERLTEDQLRQQIQNSNGTYQIRTMQGENITATMEGDEIILRDASGNQARITESDTEASDGVVHVIDGVLRPKDPTRNEAASRMNNNTNTGNSNTDM